MTSTGQGGDSSVDSYGRVSGASYGFVQFFGLREGDGWDKSRISVKADWGPQTGLVYTLVSSNVPNSRAKQVRAKFAGDEGGNLLIAIFRTGWRAGR